MHVPGCSRAKRLPECQHAATTADKQPAIRIEPTAVEPTTIEPTAIESTAIESTAVELQPATGRAGRTGRTLWR